ncbi:hypothetical protein [Sodalis-like endosymbiont of Proechinophthirus fluctus]|nr:hypothetical protein [Sodalis-like endosymbiont of Proechinophthirus fluctus]
MVSTVDNQVDVVVDSKGVHIAHPNTDNDISNSLMPAVPLA